MRVLLSRAVVIFFTPLIALGQSGSQGALSAGIQDRLIAAWRLVWLEEADADGKVHRADCTGLLVYTHDGHMSVQVMYRNPQTGGQAGPVQYAQGGYEASFGKYETDERTHTFTFTSRAPWYRASSGKTFCVYSRFPAISSS
jgi:Lipocalin-like domain